jgi:hypothetical protein
METAEQAQMRRHLAEMSHVARLLGKDVRIKVHNAQVELGRLSQESGRGFEDGMARLRDDMHDLGRTVDKELAELPGQVRDGAVAAGTAISGASVRVASATRDAFETAGNRARVGTKNALASAAGVNRKPMRVWHPPSNEGDESPR